MPFCRSTTIRAVFGSSVVSAMSISLEDGYMWPGGQSYGGNWVTGVRKAA